MTPVLGLGDAIARKTKSHTVRPGSGMIRRGFFRALDMVTGSLSFASVGPDCIFAVMMGMKISNCLPWSMSRAKKYVFLFDAWPGQYDKITRFVHKYSVDVLYVTALQSQEVLSAKLGSSRVKYVPEGISPELYSSSDSLDKKLDVINLGRTLESHHNALSAIQDNRQRTYLSGVRKFPTHQEMSAALASARISICFPANQTHPARAGNVSTMTLRYLEAMASKCLIVGSTPHDMRHLFDYDPVIQADLDAPVEQIDHILKHYDSYLPLVERNYREVLTKHTWERRWHEILDMTPELKAQCCCKI
ncbi:glycosyltransferase [Cyanobium sp. Copco_Reservoir_LC18]|uniref:glycosyltransferase n=1 Tax=Cyanobium sp. Copco_Reservoir_LC18 TaxID=1328305 RepID=UPI0013594F2A|nr:glycosyltransferase [Cyanobium sp. Copco_Reservoir_LC18]